MAVGSGSGGDRRRRATRTLVRATTHLEQYLDHLVTLTQDSAAVAGEMLESEDYSFSRWVADVLALSINAWAPVIRCLDRGGQDDPGSSLTLWFDIRSEMAGPRFVSLPAAGMKVVGKTDLMGGAGGKILKSQVVLRITGDQQLIVSLRDLRGQAPGIYQGTVTLADSAGQRVKWPIVAICKETLWWQ